MILNDRQTMLVELLEEKKQMTVNKMCEKLYTSPATIRRDLALLEANGYLHRIRGGAVCNFDENMDPPILLRMNREVRQKTAVAIEAGKFLKDGMTIFLDSSTTTSRLCPEICKRSGITVVTNNVRAFIALLDFPNVRTIMCGGESFSRAYTFSHFGVEMLNSYFADIFFFSCSGISKENEISDNEDRIVEFKKAMMVNSAKQILMCTSSKVGAISYCKLCGLDVPTKVICDDENCGIFDYFSEDKIIIAK